MVARDAKNSAALELLALLQPVQRGQGHLVGQVSGDPEDHHDVRVAVGGALAHDEYPGRVGNALGAGTAVAIAVLPLALLFVARRPIRHWHRRLRRPVARSLVVLRRLRRAPTAAVTAVGLSLLIQGGFVMLNAWIGNAIGVGVPLSVWLFVWPLAKIAGLMPISLGGLAVRDATLAALLAPAGVPLALGVVAALIWQSVLICGGLIGGVVWWGLGERSPKWRVQARSA